MEQLTYTGKDIGVCFLDTGISDHPDFKGRIQMFVDFISNKKTPYDDNGHGTHVAGILCGDGSASGGKYKGVAPGCRIIAVKVLDRMGNGNKEDVLQAFQWILKNYQKYRIRIVNISVGTIYRTWCDHHLLSQGVEELWDQGLVVVAAAGNQGPKPGSITAPGSSKKVITVGSSDMLIGSAGVSGRGPTFECVCKPDLVAPGNRITSCLPGGGYGIKSGTSMSTPFISGAIARMMEKDPLLTNVEKQDDAAGQYRRYGASKKSAGMGKIQF